MKQVLVIAKYHQSEALRVAAGLTLLNDSIKVDVIGKLDDSPDVSEQKEVLDFAEVPCEIVEMDNDAQLVRIAQDLMAADVAFLL